jgi:RING finger/CHY zinc finger protein 1
LLLPPNPAPSRHAPTRPQPLNTPKKPQPKPHQDADADPVTNAQAGTLGCQHYRRRCKIVAPCCSDEVFWCRHCHNAAKDEAEPDPAKRHTLIRTDVREVVCALCDERQPVAPKCRSCRASFGRYYCALCVFFDDDLAKGQWHCHDCGICRVGGESNFFHCASCNACLSIALRDGHRCTQDAMKRACPICFEYLFDSVRPISVLPRCGHVLHADCFGRMLASGSVTCPLCMRTAVTPHHRDRLWQRLDDAVAATPMPAEYQGVRVPVLCNDCGSRSQVQFHVVGHKCSGCGGYNTRRV